MPMKNLSRKIFFWTLTILFLTTAPLVVLHARGYRFDLGRGVFVYSGTITFKVNPQNVKTQINDEIIESKKFNVVNNSYNITGLLPSLYDIKISAEGYQTWSKKTDVHSGLSSEFWNVLLIRNNYEKTNNNAQDIEKFFTSPKNDSIAYTVKTENKLSVKILNIDSGATETSFEFPDWILAEEDRMENIEWSPNEDYLSIPVKKITGQKKNLISQKAEPLQYSQNGYGYFIADLKTGQNYNLNQLLEKEDIRYVRWDPKQKGFLFFLSDNSLYRVDTGDIENITLISSDVSSYDLFGSGVYYVKKTNNLVFKNSLDAKSEPVQITNEFPGDETTVISRIIAYDDSRISLLSQDKNLYIFNKGEYGKYFRKLSQNIFGAHFSDDGKKLLFWSDYEIFTYFLRDWNVQPVRAENELQNITRYSEPIANVQWFTDYEHVIFSSGRWIKIIELDSRDHRNCMDLANSNLEKPFAIYNNALEKLFFIDIDNGKNNLYSITMPEPSTILGIPY